MQRIRINSDNWDDFGKVYQVISFERRVGSTATELVLEYDGQVVKRTVAIHNIEWLDD